MEVKPQQHSMILKKHTYLLAQYPNQDPPSWLDFCLPPPAPALAPNEHTQACQRGWHKLQGQQWRRNEALISMHNAWWNEEEQPSPAQPWHHVPDEFSKAWAVRKQSAIYHMRQFHSLLSHLTCAPPALHRKSNTLSIWQRVWQSFPDGYYWCIPPSATLPVIIVVISVC